MTQAIRSGSSWSGRERNAAFLNIGQGRFVDASAVSGFDFTDDARAVAKVDWDFDGRLDVFIKNRTGPQLRFLKNETTQENGFVTLRLNGTTSNRDAIGAVVELIAGGTRRVQQVAAGSGYLAQSTSLVHFGLGDKTSIEELRIHWPGGDTESIQPPAVNGFYHVVEGAGRAQPLTIGTMPSAGPAPADVTIDPPSTRLLLKTPLPLPPRLLKTLGYGADRKRSVLVNLWAHWCEPCAEEIRSYAVHTNRLRASSIEWFPVSLDQPDDHEAATDWLNAQFRIAGVDESPTPVFLGKEDLRELEVLIGHVTGRAMELPIPASLLIDAHGNLQMLYFGSVFPDRFLPDANTALDASLNAARRSLFGGRWYYRSTRNYRALAEQFETIGQTDAARFYDSLGDSD